MSDVMALKIRFGSSLFALVFAAILVQTNVLSNHRRGRTKVSSPYI